MVVGPKDIAVFIEDDGADTGRIAYAAGLAKLTGAHVAAIFVARPIEITPSRSFAVGGALRAMLHDHQAATVAAAERAGLNFAQCLGRLDVSGEWRVAMHESGEALMLHARHADLAVIGPSEHGDSPPSLLADSEALIFASGGPTLLLPRNWPPERLPRRILVGWNGSREATRAIADAMPYLAAAETVTLLVVPEERTRYLYGEDPGTDICRHLARHGVPVTLEQQEGEDAGTVLLERAAALTADLIVVGAYGRSRLSEMVFGGVTRTLLKGSAIPILLSC